MNKEELKNSLITRGIIFLLFFVGSILYACTLDTNKSINTCTKKIVEEKAEIKNKLQVNDSHDIIVTTIKCEGHDLIITRIWAGVGTGVSSLHDPKICEKCRAEQGLPPN